MRHISIITASLLLLSAPAFAADQCYIDERGGIKVEFCSGRHPSGDGTWFGRTQIKSNHESQLMIISNYYFGIFENQVYLVTPDPHIKRCGNPYNPVVRCDLARNQAYSVPLPSNYSAKPRLTVQVDGVFSEHLANVGPQVFHGKTSANNVFDPHENSDRAKVSLQHYYPLIGRWLKTNGSPNGPPNGTVFVFKANRSFTATINGQPLAGGRVHAINPYSLVASSGGGSPLLWRLHYSGNKVVLIQSQLGIWQEWTFQSQRTVSGP